MTNAELEEIRERWAKATPGPWKINREDGSVGEIYYRVFAEHLQVAEVCDAAYSEKEWMRARGDAIAISKAPEDTVALLAEVDRLRVEHPETSRSVARRQVVMQDAEIRSLRAEVDRLRAELRDAIPRAELVEALGERHGNMVKRYVLAGDDCDEADVFGALELGRLLGQVKARTFPPRPSDEAAKEGE